MTDKKKHKNKYNHYAEDFRREAVRRSEGPNTSAVEVARELGIHVGQIWRAQYKRLSDKQFNSVKGVDYLRSLFSWTKNLMKMFILKLQMIC